jgi:hypothetical protein
MELYYRAVALHFPLSPLLIMLSYHVFIVGELLSGDVSILYIFHLVSWWYYTDLSHILTRPDGLYKYIGYRDVRLLCEILCPSLELYRNTKCHRDFLRFRISSSICHEKIVTIYIHCNNICEKCKKIFFKKNKNA